MEEQDQTTPVTPTPVVDENGNPIVPVAPAVDAEGNPIVPVAEAGTDEEVVAEDAAPEADAQIAA